MATVQCCVFTRCLAWRRMEKRGVQGQGAHTRRRPGYRKRTGTSRDWNGSGHGTAPNLEKIRNSRFPH